MSKIINHNDRVIPKVGGYSGKHGVVTLVATLNSVKRYYVKFGDEQVKWYTYYQLKKI